VKVARAEAHGLPAPELPQPAKKAPRDPVLRDEFARKSPAAAGARAERAAAANQNSGLPTIYKVLIGAAAAVGLVFGLSQLRKSDQTDVQQVAEDASTSPSNELSSHGLSRSVPADAPVPVIDAAIETAEDDGSPELNSEELSAGDEPSSPEPEQLAPASPNSVNVSPGVSVLSDGGEPKTVAPSQPKIVAPVTPKVVAPTEPTIVQPSAPNAPQTVTPKAPATPQAPATPAPSSASDSESSTIE
jgi:hypothetical protein